MAEGEIAEKKGGRIEELLNDMKTDGIAGGLMRKDGVVVKSTVALPDVAPGMISRCSNIAEALMEKTNDSQKESEISFTGGTIVSVPMKKYIFYGIAKNKEEKVKVIEYSKKARSVV